MGDVARPVATPFLVPVVVGTPTTLTGETLQATQVAALVAAIRPPRPAPHAVAAGEARGGHETSLAGLALVRARPTGLTPGLPVVDAPALGRRRAPPALAPRPRLRLVLAGRAALAARLPFTPVTDARVDPVAVAVLALATGPAPPDASLGVPVTASHAAPTPAPTVPGHAAVVLAVLDAPRRLVLPTPAARLAAA